MDDQLVVKYIRTKNKIRKIVTYKENGELRKYHENVVQYLNQYTSNSIFAKAYVPGASIYKNAKAHMYNDIFLKMDIKDFFPSLDHRHLVKCLYFEINKNTQISRKECFDIVKRCSISHKGLPLGLVPSPALANLYMKEFDEILYGKIKKIGLSNPIYTRYADDLVVSFKDTPDYEEKADRIKRETKDTLKRFCLNLNDRKTELLNLNRSNHVRITGVSVIKDENNYRHISVGKKLKNKIFWDAVRLNDHKDSEPWEVARLKGIFSFVLSIEKEGIEDSYSAKMREIIQARGYNSLKDMIHDLGKTEAAGEPDSGLKTEAAGDPGSRLKAEAAGEKITGAQRTALAKSPENRENIRKR